MGFWDQLRQQGFDSRRLDEKLGEAAVVYSAPSPPSAASTAVGEEPLEELALDRVEEEEADSEFMLEIAEDDELDEALLEEAPEVAGVTDPGAPEPAVEEDDADALIIASDTQVFRRPAAEPEDAHAGEDTVTDSVFDPDDRDEDTQKFPVGPLRYPNSLKLPDSQVIAILRDENYPHLEDVDDDALVALSRLEEELMERAVELGEAYLRLQELIASRDLWQAAIWVTGMHRDPMMREGLRRLRQEGSSSAARWLGWMVWPYTEELLGAVIGFEDPAGISAACQGLADVLRRRAALIRSGPHSMSLEAARYPAEAQGIFRREGFRWLAE